MTDPTPTPASAAPAQPAARTFTQEELNAVAAREKDSGKGAGRRERDAELAEQLGVPVDELPGRLEAIKTEADSRKSEAQRAKEAADAAKATADQATATANARAHQLTVERQLLIAGIPPADRDLLADAVALVRAAPHADEAAIDAAIEKVKERHPAMFGGAPTRRPVGGPPDVRPPVGRPSPSGDGRDPQVERQLRQRGILKQVS